MKKLFTIIILGLVACTTVYAEVLVPYQKRNKVKAVISADITQDTSTHLYTYTYTVANDPTSEQSIDKFAFEIDESTPIIEVTSPTGWSSNRYSHKDVFAFSSTEGITEEDIVVLANGGFEIKSPYDIKPGKSLCCFIFKTFSAPSQGNVYIQGYAPTLQSTGEEPEIDITSFGIKSGSIEDNSFVTVANVPKAPLYDGNRRPSIDGFVAPINFSSANQDEFTSPLTIYLVFAINNEVVFTDTFKATLNGVDITQQFIGDTSSRTAKFTLDATSPLQLGSNKLILSVEGVVPESTRHAVDTDQIIFKVLN